VKNKEKYQGEFTLSAMRKDLVHTNLHSSLPVSDLFPNLLIFFFSLNSETESVFASLPTSTIAKRLTPQLAIKLRADIELTCYTPAGIDKESFEG